MEIKKNVPNNTVTRKLTDTIAPRSFAIYTNK